MKFKALLYHFYRNVITELLRILLSVLLASLVVVGFVYKIYPNIFITLLGLFLMFEVFFWQKIEKYKPKFLVKDNTNEPFDSFTIEALAVFAIYSNTKDVLSHLLKLPSAKFILSKLDASEKEIQTTDLDKSTLAKGAFEWAKNLNGNYVTTADIFGAYLAISEEKTKFLFDKKLKHEDLQNILLWASDVFADEEMDRSARINFAGEGVAEDWVYGWTLETKKYMVDVTRDYVNQGEPVIRQNEYLQTLEALNKGSVILVGEVGTGKESIVRYFANESYMGRLAHPLYHQRVYRLMIDALMAGANTQGELEERLNLTMQELSHAGNVIVYIPEFQNILGSDSFHLDVSGALIPYLQNKNLKIIASITSAAFKKFVEPDASLLDNFSVVNFSQVEKNDLFKVLFSKVLEIENANKVTFSYRALLAGAEYGSKYSKERVEPGASVILLEDTANAVHIAGREIVEESDVLTQVKKKTHVDVGEPNPVEKNLLLNLEKEIHKRIIDQEDAVSAIAQALRRIRAGISSPTKPISFLFLGPTGVGKTETSKALADIYFGSANRFLRFDMSEFGGEDGEKRLLGSPPGEGDEKGQLTEAVYDNPYSLVLLDEFEKANQKILDLFLQVLDDGRLTDNKGKTVSFVNSIIIATSNAASEYIREQVVAGSLIDKKFKIQLINFLETKGIFKPELLNRFDDIIVFKPLGPAEIKQIVKLLLIQVSKDLKEKDINISFETPVIDKIADEGFDKDFGARPLKRYIQDNIEDTIAQKMLKDEIKRGDKILVSVDSSNKISIT